MAERQMPYSLRIDDKVLDKIRGLAKLERRSLNMQIELILDEFANDYERMRKVDLLNPDSPLH